MVQIARLNWSAAGSAGGFSTISFMDDATPTVIAGLLNDFTAALAPALANSTTVVPDTVIQVKDTASGALTGALNLPGGITRTGSGAPPAVPNAAQGLIRLRTSAIIGGRFLVGRIFVPGMSTSTVLSSGEVNTTGLNALRAAGAALDAGGAAAVWHRPVNGAGGQLAAVGTTDAWTEFAVQRRRRS